MTVKQLLDKFVWLDYITIDGYCDNEYYAYYRIPDNFKYYKNAIRPKCLQDEDWWNEVKGRKVRRFEFYPDLEKPEINILLED